MQIYELMELFIDPESQEIEVFSLSQEEVLYRGLYSDIDEECDDDIINMEICSIDNLNTANGNVIIVNVE